jgi:hypothetical protein
VAAAALLIAGIAATPADSAGAITTSLLLPLININAIVPADPCLGLTPDNVNISGMVHVVSVLIPATR